MLNLLGGSSKVFVKDYLRLQATLDPVAEGAFSALYLIVPRSLNYRGMVAKLRFYRVCLQRAYRAFLAMQLTFCGNLRTIIPTNAETIIQKDTFTPIH